MKRKRAEDVSIGLRDGCSVALAMPESKDLDPLRSAVDEISAASVRDRERRATDLQAATDELGRIPVHEEESISPSGADHVRALALRCDESRPSSELVGERLRAFLVPGFLATLERPRDGH